MRSLLSPEGVPDADNLGFGDHRMGREMPVSADR